MANQEILLILSRKAQKQAKGTTDDRLMRKIEGFLQSQAFDKAQALKKESIEKKIEFLLDNYQSFEEIEAIIQGEEAPIIDKSKITDGPHEKEHPHAHMQKEHPHTQTHSHPHHK